MIRDASIDDAQGAADLLREVSPEFVTSAEAILHGMRTAPPESRRRWWCVDGDGGLAGWASAWRIVETSDPDVGWMHVSVGSAYRRRGIGTALAAACEEHARELGLSRVHAWSRTDDRSLAFARARGGERKGTSDLLVVDPRTVTPPELPAGVEVLPFRAFADDPRPVHHVDTVSVLDEPGEVKLDAIRYDEWLETYWGHPLVDQDASMVAVVDGDAVAFTLLHADRTTGSGTNNGTGTLPDHRGRGLAKLAKRASLARAGELGVTAVYTGNDTTNAPMQAINRALGYVPFSSLTDWSLALTT